MDIISGFWKVVIDEEGETYFQLRSRVDTTCQHKWESERCQHLQELDF